MTFRSQASIDPNQHKGLVLLNSITASPLIATGLSLTNAQPIHVAIVDNTGSQITSFGGGTQYTDGGTPPANPVGPTLEFNKSGTWATVGTSNPLPAIITSATGGQVTVTGGKLDVNATISGAGGGTSSIDKAAFTVGSDSGTPVMGVFQTVLDTITSGTVAVAGLTPKRGLMVNLQTAAGAETGVAATPLQVSLANTGANSSKLLVTADPITFASAQPVNATLSAETTKVIGVTRTADGSGNLLTSTGNALDVNLKTSSITLNVSAAQSGTWTIATNADGTVGAGTAASKSLLAGAVYNSTEISPTTGQGFALQADSKGRLRQVIYDAAGNTRGANVNASNQLSVSVDNNPALGASSAVIGHVIADSGSTTAVTGNVTVVQGTAANLKVDLSGTAANATAIKVDGSASTQPISGTVTANAGTNLNTSLLALESGGNLASIKTDVDNLNLAQGSTTSGQKGNLILGAVTTAAPTYTTAQSNPLSLTTTGLLRVDGSAVTQPVSMTSTTITGTVAVTQSTSPWVVSNGGTFAVQATLAAETTKVIGTVRTADGSGNLYTSNSTTYTAKIAQDGNLLGTLGTAFSTAGKVDIKGADGDVFVRQATAANLNATVVGTGTFAVQNTPVAPTTVFNGKTSTVTAGTRVALAASQAVQSVTIKALITNTGVVYVGNSTVSSANGFQLSAGETISLDVANLNTVNIDTSVSGEGVTYIGIN